MCTSHGQDMKNVKTAWKKFQMIICKYAFAELSDQKRAKYEVVSALNKALG